MKGVIWDLCSGLGGWTEAFVQDGWTVVRIETNPLLQYIPHTHQLDVTEWIDWADRFPHPDIIVASPPCLDFSMGFNAPGPTAAREGRPFTPDMAIVVACKEIIDHFTPTFWAVENVVGAIPHFTPLLGPVRQRFGPFQIWGNVPHLLLGDLEYEKKTDNWDIGDPLRANHRALIPFEISFQLLQTVKSQKTLWDFL